MSERKVLNKYYPPDFDPSKIPKGKRNKNAVFNIRIMAPFNMRCNMCKEYIYKGKKFNSRKEDVMDETYLGLRIFRFYIKCPRCVSEIAFKTDLENTDYTLEAGATRLFEAEKLAMKMAEQEMKEKEEDEMNPMKLLENRTKTSRQEMDQIDSLEEIREINSRKNIVNTDEMIEKYRKYEELLQQLQIEQEEKEIREIFGEKGGQLVKRLNDSDDEGEPAAKKPALTTTTTKPTEILAPESSEVKTKPLKSWEKSVGSLSSKSKLKGLVVRKKHAIPAVSLGNQTIKTQASSSQGQSCGTNDLASEKPAITLTENENSESIDKKTIDTIDTAAATKQSDHTSENISKQPGKVTNGMVEQSAQQIVKDSIPVKETPKMSSGGKGAISLICAYSDSDSDTSN